MRVSYVRKIKDQIPLSQSELNIIKFTLMNAIKHHNNGVLEPLFTRGVPLLMVLYNGKTALRTAFEANSPEIVEMLLIESMRTFQLFPEQDIIDCFDWTLSHRHYALVDLMMFAVKQTPTSLKKNELTLKAVDSLEKLIDLLKKGEAQSYHFKEFETLLHSTPFNKNLCFYLYYKWEKECADRFEKSTECYRIMANYYQENDAKQRKEKLNGYKKSIILEIIGIFFFFSLVGAELVLNAELLPLALPALLALGLTYHLTVSFRDFKKLKSITHDALQDRALLRASRDGDYAKVSELINQGAHINCLCGIGETTALYEAMLFKHQPIINLLQQFNAYSGQRNKTLVFP